MERIQKVFESINNEQLEVTEKTIKKTNEVERIIQLTRRNKLRLDSMLALLEDFRDMLDIDVLLTEDGITFVVPNAEEGFVSMTLNLTVKSLDYEPYESAEEYEKKSIETAEKLQKSIEKKRIEFENAVAARLKRDSK